jgi:EAL domain-containing protein (putative c-di-GMP-specific phosphodiesterase class I)
MKEKIIAALKDDRFIPWFQPIMGLADNKVTHYEALARMIDLDGSVILPGPFIDIAERFGLVGAISRAIFTKAFALQEKLQRAGTRSSSASMFGQGARRQGVFVLLKSSIFEKDNPGNLVFEITETASINDLTRPCPYLRPQGDGPPSLSR